MKTDSTSQGSRKGTMFILLLITAILIVFCGIPIAITYFDIGYAFFAGISVILISTSLFVSIKQKKISGLSIILVISGLLFFIGGGLELGYAKFSKNLSILDEILFRNIIRPTQMSRGLAWIAMGVLMVYASFSRLNTPILESKDDPSSMHRHIGFLISVMGILLFFLGVSEVLDALNALKAL